MKIDFYFDPACPWCWVTSRWIVEVQQHRNLEVNWRSFSLLFKNQDSASDEYLEKVQPSHSLLRVIEAAREQDPELPGKLYTEFGIKIHHDKVSSADGIDLAGILTSCGADPSLAVTQDEKKWDKTIRESMQDALDLAGNDVGTPIIAFEGKAAYFGPVITHAPTGKDALTLFDSLSAMALIPGFYELKRTRTEGPVMPELSTSAAASKS